MAEGKIKKDSMFFRFSLYGFLKNLRFFEPYILLIFRGYGFSYLQIGLLYSIRDISANLLELPTGILADSFGRRRAMVGAFLSYIISFLMLYFLSDFTFLALAMVLFALGEAFRSGTHKALILEYLSINKISDLKVLYYGLTRSASQLGSALNALVAAGLAFYTGSYRFMFLAATVPYLLDLINVASYPSKLDGKIPGFNREEVWPRIKTTLEAFIAIFKEAGVFRALMNSSGFTAFFKSTKDYLQPILAALALSMLILEGLNDTRREALIIGIVYFVIYLLSSLASRNAYQVSERFGSLGTVLNVTYLSGVVLYFLAGWMTSLEINLVAAGCFLGLHLVMNLRRPINVGLISDQIDSKVMASGLSAEAQLTTLLVALFAPLLGFLADTFGVGGGIGLMGVLMLILYSAARITNRG